jgi:hypothetical protein
VTRISIHLVQLMTRLAQENDPIALNRQLDRFGYETLGDLVKDLMAGKITRMADDKQIDAMKSFTSNWTKNGSIR